MENNNVKIDILVYNLLVISSTSVVYIAKAEGGTMRFIQTWSYACANFLMTQMKENHEKRRVYYFGFQVVIGTLFEAILLVGAALLLGVFLPMLVTSAAFIGLRVIAGGYHMDTYGKCTVATLVLFLITSCISGYTHTLWSSQSIFTFIFICFALVLPIIIKWAPSDTPNRPISDPEEIRKFKRLSITYIFLWLAAALVLAYYKQNLFVLASCFGILLEAFIITPAAYRLFDKLSGKRTKTGI